MRRPGHVRRSHTEGGDPPRGWVLLFAREWVAGQFRSPLQRQIPVSATLPVAFKILPRAPRRVPSDVLYLFVPRVWADPLTRIADGLRGTRDGQQRPHALGWALRSGLSAHAVTCLLDAGGLRAAIATDPWVGMGEPW